VDAPDGIEAIDEAAPLKGQSDSLTIGGSNPFMCSLDPLAAESPPYESRDESHQRNDNLVEAVILPFIGQKNSEMINITPTPMLFEGLQKRDFTLTIDLDAWRRHAETSEDQLPNTEQKIEFYAKGFLQPWEQIGTEKNLSRDYTYKYLPLRLDISATFTPYRIQVICDTDDDSTSDWDGELRYEIPICWILDGVEKNPEVKFGVGDSVSKMFRIKNNNAKGVDLVLTVSSPFSTGKLSSAAKSSPSYVDARRISVKAEDVVCVDLHLNLIAALLLPVLNLINENAHGFSAAGFDLPDSQSNTDKSENASEVMTSERRNPSVVMDCDEDGRIIHLKTVLTVTGTREEFEAISIKIHAKFFLPTLQTILPPPLSRTSLSFSHDFGLQFLHERVRVHIPVQNSPSRSAAWWTVQILRPPNPEPNQDPWLLLEQGIFAIKPTEGFLDAPSSRSLSFAAKSESGQQQQQQQQSGRFDEAIEGSSLDLSRDFRHHGFLTVFFTPRETKRYRILFNIEGFFGESAIEVEITGKGSPDQAHDVHQTF